MKTLTIGSCALLLGVLANASIAAPSVSGVAASGGALTDGAAVTISGSGFTSHSMEIQWLGGSDGLIDTGTVGQTPANTGGWIFDQGYGCNMKVANTQAHSGTKSLFCALNGNNAYNGAIRYKHSHTIAPNQDIFASWWVRRNHTGDGQWKMFRIVWENNISDTMPETTIFNWYNSSQFIVRATGTTADPMSWNMPMPTQDARWYRVDVAVHTSSVGGTDGSYTMSVHDPVSGNVIDSNTMTGLTYSSSTYYQWFLWQNYIGNGLATQDTWLDDLYLQVGTKARLELGDAPVWNNCKFREIQVPTSWSSSSISMKLNKGAFKAGDTAYLFVVDSNGVPSAGYPITIGGTTQAAVAAPNPPGGVTVSITN